jgi:hypothetical protein
MNQGVWPVAVGGHGRLQDRGGLVQVGSVVEEAAAERDRVLAAQRPRRGDGAVLLSGDVQVRELGERLSGSLRGREVVQGHEALLILGDDPVPDWDVVVEGVGELGCSAGSTISRLA